MVSGTRNPTLRILKRRRVYLGVASIADRLNGTAVAIDPENQGRGGQGTENKAWCFQPTHLTSLNPLHTLILLSGSSEQGMGGFQGSGALSLPSRASQTNRGAIVTEKQP